MPIPEFYDAEAGKSSLENRAREIVGNLKWVLRWSREIIADGNLDLKKAAQLYIHCRTVRTVLDEFRDGSGDIGNLREALISEIERQAGVIVTNAEINTLMSGFYVEAGTFVTFVEANYPQTAGRNVAYYVVLNMTTGQLEEDYEIVSPTPAAVLTRVQALRDLFG